MTIKYQHHTITISRNETGWTFKTEGRKINIEGTRYNKAKAIEAAKEYIDAA